MKEIRRCLTDFNFPELFTQRLLWEGFRAKHAFEVNGQYFEVEGVAEKRGLVAFVCRPAPNQPFPGSAERKRIGREIEKLHHEHLVVFIDREQTRQVWAVPKREEGKSKGTSEIPFFKGKGVEHLARRIQKLSFSLEESETTTLPNVVARVNQALLAERVTKKFFKEFSDQRKAFVKFLDWIEDESKRDWYCSVLLNRLMFIYFLGGKGFLPGGTGFLTNNLAKNIKDNGADTFYTHFLLPLSFFGLGEKKGKRGRFEETFKDVLYLDGGLFSVHQVERELGLNKEAVEKGVFPAEAKIPDIEFKRWFDYFDKWRWTLDEDKVENDGYISPHILGYIFEKYINQKQMGAYYTKEDITGYICRNTIIPRLFDMLAESGERGKKSVRPLPVGPHPNLLNDGRGISDGEGIDRYIYASVKQEGKLPTETDYEQEQRRKRYEGILEDFDAERIQGIDDFITFNLDIEKLALDFVSNIQDPEVLHAFYFKGLQQITVLDPTCGSGAFLFEALIILYPLYNACLSRMRYLVGKATGDEPDVFNWGGRLHFDDLDVDGSTLVDLVQGGGTGSRILDDLRAEVERINVHPSAEYFIKKSIIVNNLFGVDIMEEAVEICKLRLFLTLIATVERDDSRDNFGVEPLPDIDFSILPGNTIVGYTSIADIDRLWKDVELGSSTLAFEKDHSKLKNDLSLYARRLDDWRQFQLGTWKALPVNKQSIVDFANSIKGELDKDLWRLYRTAGQVKDSLTQESFVKTHEPLHWLLAFPGIEAAGGFDVIVGNPPYKNYIKKDKATGRSILDDYKVVGYKTLPCNDLYGFVFEQCLRLRAKDGRFGMIVPLSITFSRYFDSLRALVRSGCTKLWHSSYDNIPDRLFTSDKQSDNTSKNNQQRTTIVLLSGEGTLSHAFGSWLHRWKTSERPVLFHQLAYSPNLISAGVSPWSKVKSAEEVGLLQALLQCPDTVGARVKANGQKSIVVPKTAGYYIAAYEDALARTKQGMFSFQNRHDLDLSLLAINSNLFFWWYRVYGDGFDVTQDIVESFPLPELTESLRDDLAARLRQSIERCRVFKGYRGLQVPNVNLNQELDLLMHIDKEFLAAVGQPETLTRTLMLSKSNSFISFEVPKSGSDDAEEEDED